MAYCQKYIDDIDRILKQVVDKDNKQENLANFNRSAGVRESLNENLIPEQLFDDPNTKEKEAEGISAVKALQIASKEGQTIYTINQDNYSQILPKLNHSSDVMRDVANAVNAGKEVTISERQIRAFGWSGTGFIVLDPYTGYGAYLIDGGNNGGWTDWTEKIKKNSTDIGVALTIISIFAVGLASVGTAVAAMTVTAYIAGILGILLSAYMLKVKYFELIENANSSESEKCIASIFSFVSAINLGLGVYALFANPALAVVLMFPILLYGDSLAEASAKTCNVLSKSKDN